jgi:hypothetical protein
VTAVEDARAAYSLIADAAPRLACHRFRRYLGCLSCGPRLLAVDAASLDIDNAQAGARPYRGPSVGLLGGTP